MRNLFGCEVAIAERVAFRAPGRIAGSTMNNRLIVGIAIGAVLIAGTATIWILRPQNGYERLVRSAAHFDQTTLAQMSDTAALQDYYAGWLRAFMRNRLEEDSEVARLGLEEAIIANSGTYIEETAAAYSSPAGIRALVEKCDPREQSDEARAKAPDVDRAVRVVGWSAMEVTCPAPGGARASYDLERRGLNDWKIVRVRLPSQIGDSVSQRPVEGG